MRQTDMVVGVGQGQLLAQAGCALAQGGDTPADRRHMRRREGLGGFSLTEGPMRRGGQACPHFGFSRALTSVGLRWRDRLALDSSGGRSQPAKHEEEPHQSDEPEFVAKEGWYHANAPTDHGDMRAW